MSEDRSTAVIIAGLNARGYPMMQPGRFSDAIEVGAYDCGFNGFTSGTGLGWWNGESERSVIFAGTLPTVLIPRLRAKLARLAADYGQEAIGLVVDHGDTLVRP